MEYKFTMKDILSQIGDKSLDEIVRNQVDLLVNPDDCLIDSENNAKFSNEEELRRYLAEKGIS